MDRSVKLDVAELCRRSAPITATDTGARTITVQLCAWDEPRMVTDPWRAPYQEIHARGSLVPADPLPVYDAHLGQLIGHMDAPTDAGAGPVTTLHLAVGHRAADDVLALVANRTLNAVSMEFQPDPSGEVWSSDRTQVTRTRSLLTGCAFALYPEHSAPILTREVTVMPEPTAPEPTDAPAPEPQQLGQLADGYACGPFQPAPPAPMPGELPLPGLGALQEEMVAMRGALARLAGGGAAPAPRAPFATFGALLHRSVARDGAPELARDPLGGGAIVTHHRAWTDVTSGDVPGLLPAQQLRQLFDVIGAVQPLVEAAGTLPPPTSLTITYPKVIQKPLVGTQATQKTEIASRDIRIDPASVSVATYAGGHDVSLQVLQLSEPSFLEVSSQLYAEEMARATDAGAYIAYAAAVPATHKTSIGTADTAWNQKLFDMAGLIAADSKRFPDRLLLSTDLWVKFGGAADAEGRPLFPHTGASNPIGTASLTDPSGEVRNLRYAVDPNFPADRGVMFASAAFRASLGPVQTLTVDVPRLLGQDFAVFRFAAFAAVDPNGLGIFATGTAPTADEEMAEPTAAKARK